jgi:hypothetical protein
MTHALSDGQRLPDRLGQIDAPIAQVLGNGAYDTQACYAAINQCKARAALPPRRDARIWQHAMLPTRRWRDEHLRCIRHPGHKARQRACGYHRRGLAEIAVYRVKTRFGEQVRAHPFPAQGAALLIRCRALNLMAHLR